MVKRLALLAVLLAAPASAAYLRNVPVSLTDADGSRVAALVTGDEYARSVTSTDGYPILPDRSGRLVWAMRGDNGRLMPTGRGVRATSPRSIASWLRGVRRDLGPSEGYFPSRLSLSECHPGSRLSTERHPIGNAPRSIVNLVIFVRFADDPQFAHGVEYFYSAHNGPMPSLADYWRTVSDDKVDIVSTLLPVSPDASVLAVRDAKRRGYYQPYTEANVIGYSTDDELTEREHAMIAHAAATVEAQIPAGVQLDTDNDGTVDSLEIIVQGSPDGWSDLLWPHRWVLYSQAVTLRGLRLWSYTFQLEGLLDVSVLAHEMGHNLGAPDLYRYYGYSTSPSIYPVYEWDVMAHNLNGAPQWPLAYTRSAWLGIGPTIPTYTGNVVADLAPHEAVQYVTPDGERFVCECRTQTGYDAGLPASGVLVYRVNPNVDDGNMAGPPDALYVYRPGAADNRTQGQPQSAPLSASRPRMSDTTDPPAWLQDGSRFGVLVYAVEERGGRCTFGLSLRSPVREIL